MTSVCAVLTCFNRREATMRCLGFLEAAAGQAGATLSAVLVDDGSTDGTREAVLARYPWVEVLRADGNLYWNRGMHRALAVAYQRPGLDHVFWLNDDTHLLPDALVRMLRTAQDEARRQARSVIVVGTAADPATGRISYGGRMAGTRWRPMQFRLVTDVDTARSCDTMNGNAVLVPMDVALDVGNLDPVFEHSMGDLDYGLRARRKGHPICIAPGVVAHCSPNSLSGTHLDGSLSLGQRWRRLTGRKELPPRSWLRLTSRHGGPFWPFLFAWPYVKVVLSSALPARGVKSVAGDAGKP